MKNKGSGNATGLKFSRKSYSYPISYSQCNLKVPIKYHLKNNTCLSLFILANLKLSNFCWHQRHFFSCSILARACGLFSAHLLRFSTQARLRVIIVFHVGVHAYGFFSSVVEFGVCFCGWLLYKTPDKRSQHQCKISQHCLTQHVERVWSPKHKPTTLSMSQKGGQTYTQHVAPNSIGICFVGMLRSFGSGTCGTRGSF